MSYPSMPSQGSNDEQQAIRAAEQRNSSAIQDVVARMNRLAGRINDTRIYGRNSGATGTKPNSFFGSISASIRSAVGNSGGTVSNLGINHGNDSLSMNGQQTAPTINTTGLSKENNHPSQFNDVYSTEVTRHDGSTTTMKLGFIKGTGESKKVVVYYPGSGQGTRASVDGEVNPYKGKTYTADIVVVQVPEGNTKFTMTHSDDIATKVEQSISQYTAAGYDVEIHAYSMGGYGAVRLANKVLENHDNKVTVVSEDATPNEKALKDPAKTKDKSLQDFYQEQWNKVLESDRTAVTCIATPSTEGSTIPQKAKELAGEKELDKKDYKKIYSETSLSAIYEDGIHFVPSSVAQGTQDHGDLIEKNPFIAELNRAE